MLTNHSHPPIPPYPPSHTRPLIPALSYPPSHTRRETDNVASVLRAVYSNPDAVDDELVQ
ncbi:unnamed protein product, partial [Closterium sp. NIES-53]